MTPQSPTVPLDDELLAAAPEELPLLEELEDEVEVVTAAPLDEELAVPLPLDDDELPLVVEAVVVEAVAAAEEAAALLVAAAELPVDAEVAAAEEPVDAAALAVWPEDDVEPCVAAPLEEEALCAVVPPAPEAALLAATVWVEAPWLSLEPPEDAELDPPPPLPQPAPQTMTNATPMRFTGRSRMMSRYPPAQLRARNEHRRCASASCTAQSRAPPRARRTREQPPGASTGPERRAASGAACSPALTGFE